MEYVELGQQKLRNAATSAFRKDSERSLIGEIPTINHREQFNIWRLNGASTTAVPWSCSGALALQDATMWR